MAKGRKSGNKPEAVREEPTELREGKEEPTEEPGLQTIAEEAKEPTVMEEENRIMGENAPEAVREDPTELQKEKKEPAVGPELPTTAEETKESAVTEKSEKESENGKTRRRYQITCRNSINESFAGVSFQNGMAFTEDAFTASWFANKEGYTVHREKGS